MNIFRSKRSSDTAAEAKSDGPLATFFGSKKEASSAQPTTRRALGDITNATVPGNAGAKELLGKKVTGIVTYVETVEDFPSLRADDERMYMRREADNIDARDNDNPLLCSTYVNDMYDLFRTTEREFKVDPVITVSTAQLPQILLTFTLITGIHVEPTSY